MSEAAARVVVERLRGAGYQALYAGGSVRDHLLGLDAQDYDVATDARPDAIMRLFPRHTAVGAKFGVVLVHEGEAHIEVATFRTDASYKDGRHPESVAYASEAREDVLRRDFTINGLLMDPEEGKILDYVGGRADLAEGVIRAIGDPERRFQEDRLRMLRGVRFAARLGFVLEPATQAAMQREAVEIHEISQERVRDELTKMLTEGHARRAFELLHATGLLKEILPEVEAMRGVEQPPQYHPEGDVWTHTMMMIAALPHPCPTTLAWGVLLHDVGKPPTFRRAPDRIRFDRHASIGARMTERVCDRLRMSGAEAEQIVALVADHMQFTEVPHMRQSTLKRFLRRPAMEQHLELHRLDCSTSHGDLSLYALALGKLGELRPEEMRPPRLITGRELIAMGHRPGPRFKEILDAVEDAQLEGQLADPEAARAFVAERYPVAD